MKHEFVRNDIRNETKARKNFTQKKLKLVQLRSGLFLTQKTHLFTQSIYETCNGGVEMCDVLGKNSR